jgi:microcin C transport system substrate-binding protein
MVQRFAMSLTPGNELLTYFSSESATSEGSRNFAGIKDPVVDALVLKVMAAKNRAEVNTAARALDRVLRANHYWVSHWYKGSHHIAYWNKYDRPKVKPRYAVGSFDTWWYDAAKAAKLRPN